MIDKYRIHTYNILCTTILCVKGAVKLGAILVGEEGISDEFLLAQAREGSDFAVHELILRYMPLVRHKAGRFLGKGLEWDDLVQEGLIGFLSAVRAYSNHRGSSFSTFASHCITNRMLTALTFTHGAGNAAMQGYIPLDEEEMKSSLSDTGVDPQEIVIAREEIRAQLRHISNHLSSFEYEILRLYLGGHTYLEMAALLNSTTKAVDNALMRVRRKLRAVHS